MNYDEETEATKASLYAARRIAAEIMARETQSQQWGTVDAARNAFDLANYALPMDERLGLGK